MSISDEVTFEILSPAGDDGNALVLALAKTVMQFSTTDKTISNNTITRLFCFNSFPSREINIIQLSELLS